MKNITLKTRLIGGVTLLVIFVIAIFIATSGVFAQTGDGLCKVPDGSSFVNLEKGVYQIDGMNTQVFILRGIALGQPSSATTDKSDNIPSCYTKEEGLQTLRNLLLIDKNGNHVALVKGVGSDGSDPIPLS
jgi:hypothetical protein